MARALRFVYTGAVYHLLARGDGGKRIFIEKEDHEDFLHRLEEVCLSHGWRVHAWVLMRNHFHLLVETPEPNLISGMKLLLGSFAQAWNRRYKRRGHVFQGRYKSVPVAGERASDAAQFRVVADYIHLNPARARLAGGERGELTAFPWSSLKAYQSGKGPEWLVFERVLAGFELEKSGRGRRAYVAYLEARAAEKGGGLSAESLKALRSGWYLGDEPFKDKLLAMVEKSSLGKKGSVAGKSVREYGEQQAEKLVEKSLEFLDLSDGRATLSVLRKGDPRKVAIARLVRMETTMSNQWIAERLCMGHSAGVSRLVKQKGKDEPNELLEKFIKMFK